MAIDFEKVTILNQRLYFELNTAAFFSLSNNFKAVSAAMDRAQSIRDEIDNEISPIGDMIKGVG